MTKTILMLGHMVRWKDQRATTMLEAKGCRVEWCCPAAGDVVPGSVDGYDGMVVLGGAQNVADAADPQHAYLNDEMRLIERWLAAERPLLGICLGAQLLAATLGAKVGAHGEGRVEIGYFPIRPTAAGARFMPDPLVVYHWHYQGFDLPEGAELLAVGEDFPNQAFRYGAAYGLQFHAEATPEQIRAWIGLLAPELTRTGAQSARRQLAELPRYDPPLAAWLDRFLDLWIKLADNHDMRYERTEKALATGC